MVDRNNPYIRKLIDYGWQMADSYTIWTDGDGKAHQIMMEIMKCGKDGHLFDNDPHSEWRTLAREFSNRTCIVMKKACDENSDSLWAAYFAGFFLSVVANYFETQEPLHPEKVSNYAYMANPEKFYEFVMTHYRTKEHGLLLMESHENHIVEHINGLRQRIRDQKQDEGVEAAEEAFGIYDQGVTLLGEGTLISGMSIEINYKHVWRYPSNYGG